MDVAIFFLWSFQDTRGASPKPLQEDIKSLLLHLTNEVEMHECHDFTNVPLFLPLRLYTDSFI